MKFVCTWASKICRIFYVRKWVRQRRQTVKKPSTQLWSEHKRQNTGVLRKCFSLDFEYFWRIRDDRITQQRSTSKWTRRTRRTRWTWRLYETWTLYNYTHRESHFFFGFYVNNRNQWRAATLKRMFRVLDVLAEHCLFVAQQYFIHLEFQCSQYIRKHTRIAHTDWIFIRFMYIWCIRIAIFSIHRYNPVLSFSFFCLISSNIIVDCGPLNMWSKCLWPSTKCAEIMICK